MDERENPGQIMSTGLGNGGWWRPLKLRGFEEYSQFLSDIERNFGALSQNMEVLARDIVQDVAKNGTSGRDIHGAVGDRLKDEYRAVKEKIGKRGIRDMNFTGDMYRSLTHQVKRTNSGSAIVILFRERIQAIKASVHYFGAISGFRKGRFQQSRFEHFGITDFQRKNIIERSNAELRKYIRNYSK